MVLFEESNQDFFTIEAALKLVEMWFQQAAT